MPTTPQPILTIQTASVWSSGDGDVFSGTGGPGYDPFLGFNGVVSSQVIANSPFNDRLSGVAAGDQVVFVIALQNFANSAAAYDLVLRDLVPVGFAVPGAGPDLAVTDGAGNLLAAYGNLFDPAGGLTIIPPVGAYSDTSGANVALVSFTLQATASVAVPQANITNTAQIVSYAASEGGPNLATAPAAASTPLQTQAIQVTSAADQATTTLGSGQTASFDITVTLPAGTAQDFRITEAMPHSGNAALALTSAQIIQFGSNLSASLPVTVGPDGSILLGTVTNSGNSVQASDNQITVRVTVADGGTAAGTGTLNTTVSTIDPNTAGQRWSTTLTNTVPLATPAAPATIAGISPAQNTTSTVPVFPFSSLLLSDPNPGASETLTIHLSNPALGSFGSIPGLTTNSSGDAVLTGSVAQVQAAARTLVFTPAASAVGTETFTLTLNDAFAPAATNQQTTLAIAASANPSEFAQMSLSPQTVLTSTVTGSSTWAQAESYLGPLDDIQWQFLYDGTAPLAIVAQQPNMLIASKAIATAILLDGGNNLVDVENGSTFVTGGSGNDTYIFHANQLQVSWNTIINFHAGDSVTVYGFSGSASSDYWQPSAGASGYTGATLQMDLDRDGRIDSSITFAGKIASDIAHFTLTPGSVGGQDFLRITMS